MKTPLRPGQCLQHARFGLGIATGSDDSRTVIDFYEHGVKTFVTSMLEVELVAEAPPRPTPPGKARAKRTKNPAGGAQQG
jgi:hypothetical protein